MARQTFTLGRLFDIRVGVHVSWLAVYAFMTFALARGLGMLAPAEAFAFGAVCALALFASVVAHELAHALVARRFGVRTNAITLFLFGGVATLEREPSSPKADALIALAGPAMSAVLAVLAFALLFALERFTPDGALRGALGLLGSYVMLANAVLAVFNLIPAYPMDGGRVLRALIWRRTGDHTGATNAASRVGVFFALLFVAAGVFVVAATHDLTYGWYVILGAFLLRQGWSHERLTRRPEMKSPPAQVPAGMFRSVEPRRAS
ncbi:MAG TPA: site-2 protease family protein [Candidatus Elarobacter sp.]|nr:site-2 protease family protein [Candidatus Elarobacter sp.]